MGSEYSRQEKFLKVLLEASVLRLGQFETKSGRMSPYFFNFGELGQGAALAEIAKVYGEEIISQFPDVDVLYGPAYKGIPLAVSTAVLFPRQIEYAFNRKEKKDHGEGGVLVGASLEGKKVLIVEDVITGGTSLRESLELLKGIGVTPIGAFCGVDRQERGQGDLPAREEMSQRHGLRVEAFLNINGIVERLFDREFLGKIWIDHSQKKKIESYLKQYGRLG